MTCTICGPNFIGRCPHLPREPNTDFGEPEAMTPEQLARVGAAIRSVGLPKKATRRQRATTWADRLATLEASLSEALRERDEAREALEEARQLLHSARDQVAFVALTRGWVTRLGDIDAALAPWLAAQKGGAE